MKKKNQGRLLRRTATNHSLTVPKAFLGVAEPFELNVVAEDGQIVRRAFSRDAEGVKAALVFVKDDATWQDRLRGGGRGLPRWFQRFAIAEGFIPTADGHDPMAADEEGS